MSCKPPSILAPSAKTEIDRYLYDGTDNFLLQADKSQTDEACFSLIIFSDAMNWTTRVGGRVRSFDFGAISTHHYSVTFIGGRATAQEI